MVNSIFICLDITAYTVPHPELLMEEGGLYLSYHIYTFMLCLIRISTWRIGWLCLTYYNIYYHAFMGLHKVEGGGAGSMIYYYTYIILPPASIRGTEMDCTCHTTPHYGIYLYVVHHPDLYMEHRWLCLLLYYILPCFPRISTCRKGGGLGL